MKKETVFFYGYGGNKLPSLEPRECFIIDLDGTLADTKHRQHFMQGPKKQWKAFFAAMGGDELHEEVALIMRTFFKYTELGVIICTGRPSQYHDMTRAWLQAYKIPYSMLVMRAEGDGRPDADVKLDMLQILRSQGWIVRFAIDDRPEVVDMWRRNGVKVLQCDATMWYEQSTDRSIIDCVQSLHYHVVNNTVNKSIITDLAYETITIAKELDAKMRALTDRLERLSGE